MMGETAMRIGPLMIVTVFWGLSTGQVVLGQEWAPQREQVLKKKTEYSPYVNRHFPQRVFFGDTHHHSSFSVDSGMFGNTLGPDQSYRFARGGEVVSSSGLRVKLIRPLDFLVVSDHAEYLGLSDLLAKGDPKLLATKAGKEWYTALQKGGDAAGLTAVGMMKDFTTGNERVKDPQLKRRVWDQVVDIASKYNAPGVFTTFNGYEWTSAPGGNNLHRVVIFRDDPNRVKQILPFSAFDSIHPEDRWKALAAYEATTGGQVLAIPHNGNISNGAMFAETMSNGEPINRPYARMRIRWDAVARSHPDERRWRSPSISIPKRRVRRL
jgi:hypothetical protein